MPATGLSATLGEGRFWVCGCEGTCGARNYVLTIAPLL